MEITYFYWLISALLTFGASSLLANSTIFEPIRNFLAKRFYTNFFAKWGWLLMTCQICTSFWLGMIISSLYTAYSVTSIILLDGILATATTSIILTILNMINRIATPEKTEGCSKCSQQTEDLGHSQTENG
jgi:hypothetical protein